MEKSIEDVRIHSIMSNIRNFKILPTVMSLQSVTLKDICHMQVKLILLCNRIESSIEVMDLNIL